MDYLMDADGERRLGEYFAEIGEVLKNKKRRASFAVYAMGLLSDGERKSMEPIAARACPDVAGVDAQHQRLSHFMTDSVWSDRDVRQVAARYALSAMTAREPVQSWIVDDTGFLKQGKHSVGVQRQYTGSAGKIANCQLGVSLSVTTGTEHVPIDFELYLPKTWTEDAERRREARIPQSVVFRTKVELALDMVRRAVEDGVPRGIVLADSFYGDEPRFRSEVRALGLDYGVGVKSDCRVWRADRSGRRRGDPVTVRDLVAQLAPRKFRRVTWREGTRQSLYARFAALRVVPAYGDASEGVRREAVWLLVEWPQGEPTPTKFHFCTLSLRTPRKHLVRALKDRWRTERVYEDLKGELGLDHYEGRRFPGWHHHVSVALCCYAFVVAERVQRFPPSARRQTPDYPFALSA
ncbi:MAG: IS701 family transposase [Polyangiaceae bacterium]|nr:IS701 family transposase [Polyangiaceae bacterium]